MIVLQDDSLTSVWEEVPGLEQLQKNCLERHWGNRRQRFRWVNGIEYRVAVDFALRLFDSRFVSCAAFTQHAEMSEIQHTIRAGDDRRLGRDFPKQPLLDSARIGAISPSFKNHSAI